VRGMTGRGQVKDSDRHVTSPLVSGSAECAFRERV
jgi:hypothetical protein